MQIVLGGETVGSGFRNTVSEVDSLSETVSSLGGLRWCNSQTLAKKQLINNKEIITI